MENYVAVIFTADANAFEGLHALWRLDRTGEITVHGAAVMRRGDSGQLEVAEKQTHPGRLTAVGVGIGALLGAIAGPIGSAAGATIAAGTVAGIGAATGGLVGSLADLTKADEHEQAVYESQFAIGEHDAAVIAEVSESSTNAIDASMQRLGGRVSRRSRDTVRENVWDGPQFDRYLYPYDYDPIYAYDA